MRDAFLAERDAHSVRDADFVCDARLRRVCGTHRITYHSAAASLMTLSVIFDLVAMFAIGFDTFIPITIGATVVFVIGFFLRMFSI